MKKTNLSILVILLLIQFIKVNSQENIVNNQPGDAFIKLNADIETGGAEDNNAYIKFSQDQNAIKGILGTVGNPNKDPENNSYTGTLANSILLGALQHSTNYPALHFGTDNIVRMTILPEGNVGIGTTSPASKLSVDMSSGILSSSSPQSNYNILVGQNISEATGEGAGIAFTVYQGSSPGQYPTYTPGAAIVHERTGTNSKGKLHFKVKTSTGATDLLTTALTISDNGNVGIGTTSPESKLTVQGGTINFNAVSEYGGDYATDNSNYSNVLSIGGVGAETGLKIYKQKSGSSPTFLGGANYIDTYVFEMTDANGNDPDGGILFGATGKDDIFDKIMTIRGNGRVGIGTTTIPAEAKLAVNGAILAKEIKVKDNVTTWADFVFEPGYNLRSISEVEQYITENKNLPEIPTAEQVAEDGISLGEMNAKLLQKIEELTLYMIEQNKEIENLKYEVNELKGNQ